MTDALLSLMIRRTINAVPSRVFHAWTEPQALMAWWGPKGVSCPNAEVDLQVGGEFRIANQLPDGSILWIHGVFEEIVPQKKLVYSWVSSEEQLAPERVIVRFNAVDEGTEVVIMHQQIESQVIVDTHRYGWEGCLDGLVVFL